MQHPKHCGKENHCVDVGVKPGLVFKATTKAHMSMPFKGAQSLAQSFRRVSFCAQNRISRCPGGEQSARMIFDLISQQVCVLVVTAHDRPKTQLPPHPSPVSHYIYKMDVDGLRNPAFLHRTMRPGGQVQLTHHL